jgi:hypothetical protein
MNPTHVPHHILESMCKTFELTCNETIVERYMQSTIVYHPFEDLHMFIRNTADFIYIDKLWVESKGNGVGTRCFGQYLKQSIKPVMWRTRTERRRDWYMRFDGVRTVASYKGYYFLVHDAGQRHNWTAEDICLFKEPSLTHKCD